MLNPEASVHVTVDAHRVVVLYPNGREREFAWSAVQRIVILTTDEGPLLTDVFWVITPAGERPLVIPVGATGEDEFLQTAQATLPNFRNEQVIEAMTSTSNQEFVVWERGPDPSGR